RGRGRVGGAPGTGWGSATTGAPRRGVNTRGGRGPKAGWWRGPRGRPRAATASGPSGGPSTGSPAGRSGGAARSPLDRPQAAHRRATGRKKTMTAARRRLIVNELCEHFRVSQRRTSRALGLARSGLRYAPVASDQQAALARRNEELAGKHPRFGYRRIL